MENLYLLHIQDLFARFFFSLELPSINDAPGVQPESW